MGKDVVIGGLVFTADEWSIMDDESRLALLQTIASASAHYADEFYDSYEVSVDPGALGS
jgi:hypothetical protein